MLIYYKESLNVYIEEKLGQYEGFEAAWINIVARSQTWLLGVVYHPPKDTVFYDKLDKVPEKVWLKRKNVIMLGDFNSNLYMQGESKDNTYYGRRLLTVLNRYGLKNIITQQTRIDRTTQTLINLIIVSDVNKVISKGVAHAGISDHSIIYANIKISRDKVNPIVKTVKDFKNINEDQFKDDIQRAPWSIFDIFYDIDDDRLWAWEYIYNAVSSEHIKVRKIKTKIKKLPWITSQIRKAMNKCFKLLKKYKNTKDKTVWKEYKREKNRIRIMLRNKELKYWKGQFAQAKNSYEFWKIIQEIQGKSSNKSISTLKDGDGNIITDDLGKAKCLNKFFSSIGKKLAEELEELTT